MQKGLLATIQLSKISNQPEKKNDLCIVRSLMDTNHDEI